MRKRAIPKTRNDNFIKAIKTLTLELTFLAMDYDATAPASAQCAQWHKLRKRYEDLKAITNEYEVLSRQWSYDRLPEAFRKEGIRNVTLDGVGQFALGFRTTARVHDWDKANAFLKEHGLGDAIREMVPAATMNSIIGDLSKKGIDPDRDAIEANTYTYTSFKTDRKD